MKWLVLVGLCCACSAGDDTATGAHAQCSEGGAINSCDTDVTTAQGACWKLVDCGAIPVSSDNNNVFDWGACVDRIETSIDVGEQLTISCINASSCDALKVPGSPNQPDLNQISCMHLGGR
jgi:hypothetical protein